MAIFHELLEQPQDLLGDRRYSTSCKTAQVLFCFDYRCLTSKSLRLMCQALLTISSHDSDAASQADRILKLEGGKLI